MTENKNVNISLSTDSMNKDEQVRRENRLPILYIQKENCCGCGACYSVCPVRAIQMEEDEEGFLYPEVNYNKCIQCFRCIKVCAFKNDQVKKGYFFYK